MVNMVAVKRVKYPHGHTGKEYQPNEPFVALSDRDARGLYVAGKARYGEKDEAPRNPTDLPVARAAKSEPLTETDDPNSDSRRGHYQRRDMTAEPAGRTGEAAKPSSSRQAPAPKTKTSRKSKGAAKS